jgi:hypothetical protein
MRTHTILSFFAFIIGFTITPSALASGAPPGSASLVYQSRVAKVFMQSVVPALAKGIDQLIAAGPTKVYCRIKADGRVENVRVISAHANKFVFDTCTRMLSSTKFPPIPEAVQREQKKTYLEMSFEL